ncbi:M14 family metallopeptidase [Methylophilus sp. TWE2]|uniref:M14 family metallopeptidase n=1 Tax=Methylophilus sp. TWE2 TaxID=1662285 RepID=UPI000676C461|nr:M14 family metallopeptidase [Methylophilus sp. TWE2]AKR44655.1 succinylglutamate desuccinylase [Methylophilus sp. TWE2]
MRYLFIMMMVSHICGAFAQAPFVGIGQHVAPGNVQAWMQPVGKTALPITVIHGQFSGPVLTLTAGIHGDEFPAIFALQQLARTIQPDQLHGTLILIHLANLEGFHGHRIALSPVDEKNLNRVFPGKADGTLTEQIAYFMTEQIISKTDYLLDIHSGSANQTLLPHVYSPVMHQAPLDEKTLAFAKSLGVPQIVLYDERPHDPAHSISYPNTAQTRGKPGLTLEVGQLGQRSAEDSALILQACLNALRHLGMLDASALNASAKAAATAQPKSAPVFYRKLVAVRSTVTGIFYPLVKVGDAVASGQAVGRVENYFGQPLETLYAPVAGTVLMQKETPPIRQGESTTDIGVLQ